MTTTQQVKEKRGARAHAHEARAERSIEFHADAGKMSMNMESLQHMQSVESDEARKQMECEWKLTQQNLECNALQATVSEHETKLAA